MSRTRILVVDDDPTIRKLEEIRLTRLGHDVVTHPTARQALDALHAGTEAYSLILTDLDMPDMNGLEMGREVRRRGHVLPMLLMSGNGAGLTENDLKDAGFAAFLSKPVGTESLKSSIDRHLNESA